MRECMSRMSSWRGTAREVRRVSRWMLGLILLLSLAGCATTTPSEQQKDELKRAAAIRDVGVEHLSQGRTAMAIRKLQQAQEALDRGKVLLEEGKEELQGRLEAQDE